MVRRSKHLSTVLFTAVAAVSFPSYVCAQVAIPVFWNGGTGNWIQPGKWSPEPLDIDNVFLLWPDNTLSSNFFLVFITSGSVDLSSPITITSLSLDANAELHLSGIGALTTELFIGTGSNIQNNGLITIQDSATLKTLALGGSGHVILSDLAQVNGLALNGTGHTLRGEGTINSITALDALVNQGTILADSPGNTLRIAGIGLINDALLTANNSGRLKIETPFFTNNDLVLADGGTIDIDVVTFSHNDTLRAQNGGTLKFSSITANASGSLTEILAGSRLDIESSLLNSGIYRTVGTGLVNFDSGPSRLSGSPTLEGNFLIGPGSLQINSAAVNATHATLTATGNTVTINSSSLLGGRYTGPTSLAGIFTVSSSSSLIGTPAAATIDSATFTIPSSVTLSLSGEVRLDNSGGINFLGTAFNGSSFLAINGPVLLSGNGGFVRFGSPQNLGAHRIIPGTAPILTLGPLTTLTAPTTGTSGYVDVPLINHGTVAATGGYVELNTDSVTNTGLITASSNGRLQATRNSLPTLIDNTGGFIRAALGGTLTYSGATTSSATIRAGTLDGAGTHVNFSRLTLDGLTSGTLTLRSTDLITVGSARTTILGTVTLDNATLSLRDSGFVPGTQPRLLPDGHATLTGTGTVLFGLNTVGGSPEGLIETVGAASFTFDPNITVLSPANSNGNLTGTFNNRGTIRSSSFLFITPVDTLTNTGLIEAAAGATLEISRTQLTATVINTNGTLRAGPNATFNLSNTIGQIPSTTIIQAGTLDGTGSFSNGGNTILDGATLGPITLKNATFFANGGTRAFVAGNLILDNGTLTLRDGAFQTGTPARLLPTGHATISGTGTILLALNTQGGFAENIIETTSNTSFTFGPNVTVLLPANSSGNLAGTFNNQGNIRSESISTLTITPTLLTNTGIIEAAVNARIDLALTQSTATVINTGGILRAGPNATYNLSNNIGQIRSTTVITGGTFDGPATGTMSGGTFVNNGFVTLDASADHPITFRNSTFLTQGNTYTTILGNFNFAGGTFRIGDTNNLVGSIDGTTFLSGPVAFTGSGTLDFAAIDFGPFNAFLSPADANASLSLAAGISTTADSPSDFGTLSLPTTNAGTIHASNSGRLDFLAPSLIHSGTAKASDFGRLTFGRAALPSFIDNSAGSILATTSGTVAFGGTANVAITTIRGGLLGGDSTGNFYSGGHTLLESTPRSPITLASATFNINASSQLHLTGTFTLNNATILFQDTNFFQGNSPRLIADNAVTLKGTGTLRFASNPTGGFPEATLETGTNSLSFGPGITLLAPTATQGIFTGNLSNAGIVHAQGGSINLQTTSLTNSGNIKTSLSSTPGSLSVGTNNATILNTSGTFSAGAGTLITVTGSPISLTGGLLEGPGSFSFTGNLQFAGVTLKNTTATTFQSSQTSLLNTITLNNAALALQDNAFGGNSIARLSAANHATVTGTGSILFLPNLQAGTPETVISVTTPNTSITFGPHITVATTGSNTVGTLEGTFRNEGTIHAPSGTLALNITHLTNRGLIQTSASGAITAARPGLPSTFDNAGGTFRAGANTTITFTGSPTTITGGTLQGPGNFGFFGNVTLSDLTLKHTSAITFNNSQTSLLNTITLDNASLALQDNAFGGNSIARLSPANHATVTGTGSILFLPNLQAGVPETILSATAPNTSLTFGPNVTVATTGSNTIGTLEGTFRNEGTINANAGTIRLNSSLMVNRGTLQSSNSGSLVVQPATPSIFENDGGSFLASANSTITFSGTNITVRDGQLTGPGNFDNNNVLVLDGASTSGLLLANTTLRTTSSAQTRLLGNVSLNNATLFLQDTGFFGGNSPRLIADGHATISGIGTVLFGPNGQGGFPENTIEAALNPTLGSLTLGPSVTLFLPQGIPGTLVGTIISEGTISLAANTNLTLTANSTLTIAPTGLLEGIGTLTVPNTASLLNQGTISPGNSPGLLTITGALINTPTSTLLFEIAGTTPTTQFDQLTVNGTLVVDGTLRVNLLSSYTPSPNNAFRILAATSISGTFDTFDLPPLSPGLNWNTSQLYSHGTISTFIVIPEPATLTFALAPLLLTGRRRR